MLKYYFKLNHDENCNCCYCCNPQPTCYKYVQPQVPKSFAPIRYYWRSGLPVENDTTYQLSYIYGPTTTTEAIPPRDGLTVGDGEISKNTTYKESYLGNWCVTPESSITPCEKQWLGRGPIQDVTTQKHDYTWKYNKPVEPYKRQQNLYCIPTEISDDTTYKLSYFEPSCNLPVASYAPRRKYSSPNIPMEDNTTYQLSYWQNGTTPKEDPPWNEQKMYSPPTEPMDACTTYKLSYWPQSEKRRLPIIRPEIDNLLNAGCCSDTNTTYRLSYFGCGGDKRDLIRQPESIAFSSCPQPYDTTHRMSFMGNWCVKQEAPITPCDRQMLGRGPIEDVTTQKRDYRWKYTHLELGTRPDDNLIFPNTPLDGCTTHKLSYFPTNKLLTPVESFAPIRLYSPANVPMDLETTMQLSYQPTELPAQVEKPWSDKITYHRPVTRMEDNSTYNLRFQLLLLLSIVFST